MGDEVNLFLPQSRLLSLTQSNPALAKLLYSSAQSSARRNASTIVRKLGMPPDYFWKFEYWPKARALTTLEKIVSRVFSSMMAQAKEGNLKIVDLDVDPLRISINFANCVECAGISELKHGICYYHAGIFSGILSSLINRDLDSFETSCCASGDESCHFIMGDKENEYIKSGHNAYIAPPEFKVDLASRLEKSLRDLPVRALGNSVDINYLRLVTASILLANPQLYAATSLDVGSQLGHVVAPTITRFYGREGLQILSDCLRKMCCSCVEIKESEPEVKLVIRECADSVGDIKMMEMVSFLLGELQGLTSELTKRKMALKESRFEGDNIVLTFVPEA